MTSFLYLLEQKIWWKIADKPVRSALIVIIISVVVSALVTVVILSSQNSKMTERLKGLDGVTIEIVDGKSCLNVDMAYGIDKVAIVK